MTSLVGVAGLAADYGSALYSRIEDQRMADTAAMAGAAVYAETNSTSAVTTAVGNMASLNGYASTRLTPTLVNSPTGDGNQAVKVVVSSTTPMTFSRVLTGTSSVSVSASSYAELKSASGSGCILTLDPTASQAFTISGSGYLDAPACDVIANSSNSDALDMSGSARISAACTITVGGQKTTTGLTLDLCTKPTTGAAATPDPYAAVPAPAISGPCLTLPSPPTNVPIGYYCHGINVSSTATFQSGGTYYVVGNLAFQGGSNVTAHNVTFYVTGGTVAISGSAVVNLTAQTSGTYAGILFFGSRAGNTSNNNISGSSNSTITGALYFPTQQVTFSGGSNTPSACTEVIGDKITISGTAYLGDSCAGTGVASITPANSLKAALVQ
ncbi:MAG TPA: hypothetical protein VKR31_07825 [Rhizomicrobium sp.]|nr:hypothetical protein [Rhizomicrobium sp.]